MGKSGPWVAVVCAAWPAVRCSDSTARTWCMPPPGSRPHSAAARRTSASSAAPGGHTVGRGPTFPCTQNGRQLHSFHTCKDQAWRCSTRQQSTRALGTSVCSSGHLSPWEEAELRVSAASVSKVSVLTSLVTQFSCDHSQLHETLAWVKGSQH